MKKYTFLILLLSLIVLNQINAQNKAIHGFVLESDEKGQEIAIPGVNVYWAGTQQGTSTDVDGHFKLAFPKGIDQAKMVVSFIGYKKDTISINRSITDPLKILLTMNNELKEVIIANKAVGSFISRMEPLFTQNVTGAELRKAACCNLSESFETNASVDVSFSDAVSGAKQIQMLGLSGNYSQLMTENIPNIRGLGTAFGLNYIPGSWMQSIQISKGAASVKNGYESITGQINTEYKKPDDSELLFINLYANNYGKKEGNIYSATKLNDKLSTMLFIHGEDFNKEVDKNDDSFLDQPMMNQLNLFNRWKYEDGKNIHAQLGIKILNEERIGGQLNYDPSKPNNISNGYGININTNRYEVFTKTAYLFKNPGTNIGFINSFIHHRQNSIFGLKNYDAIENNYYGNLMFQSYIGNTNHTFTTGLSYVLDKYEEVLVDSAFNRKESVPGAFFEYTFHDVDKMSLILGMRTDFHNIHGTLFTPRAHLRIMLDENTTFRASLGKGYRTANIFAENTFLLASSRSIVINEQPEIEKAWNYGVNFTKFIDISGKQMSINAEAYYTNFSNQIIIDRDQDLSKIFVYNLKGKSYSSSFQVEVNYELFKRMDVTAAFRFNDVKTTINDELLRKPLVNKYKGLVNLSYATNLNKWQFDFTAQFNGDSRIPSTAANPIEYQREESSPTYTILNFQATKYFRKWEIYAGGENLTNFKQENPIIAANDPFGEYFDSSLIWGPLSGIKLYVGLRYRIKR
jgi:outer membrane receptor for ferrienterochelin and colicins